MADEHLPVAELGHRRLDEREVVGGGFRSRPRREQPLLVGHLYQPL
jgi:hypothetical protein